MGKRLELERQKTLELVAFDNSYGSVICGVDEAGRGPLAGPLAVCACIMPHDEIIFGINDSKKLKEEKREILFEKIVAIADYSVVLIDEKTIDQINILQATKLGMKRAIERLKTTPQRALIDAVNGLDVTVPCSSVVKCDAKSYATAAASIVAKVTRDRIMRELAQKYPQYGFERNKGYGTAEHIEALKQFGPTPSHRVSFIGNFVND